ncbi:MAG: hypothetical protein ACXVPU_10325 [Bacteroidia bacterium]
MKNKYKFLMGIKIVFGITAFVLLFGFGTMHLWNWLVPSLFHGPIINFGQAIGLLILSKILFGGFGGRHGRGGCGPGGRFGRRDWKTKMQERFSNMSPEEKEKFKQRFQDRCGHKFWMDKDQESETKTTEQQS